MSKKLPPRSMTSVRRQCMMLLCDEQGRRRCPGAKESARPGWTGVVPRLQRSDHRYADCPGWALRLPSRVLAADGVPRRVQLTDPLREATHHPLRSSVGRLVAVHMVAQLPYMKPAVLRGDVTLADGADRGVPSRGVVIHAATIARDSAPRLSSGDVTAGASRRDRVTSANPARSWHSSWPQAGQVMSAHDRPAGQVRQASG